jgi:acyl-CoA synthetase (AMP-forming)/AMP-acid ligase II
MRAGPPWKNATVAHESPGVKIETIPYTLPGLVAHAAARWGAREALVDGDIRLSWIELDRQRRRAAAGFVAAGIVKGDRIAIWAPNIWEWIVCAMGLQTLGAILVPINTRFKGGEAADILRRSGARLLFTLDEFLGVRYPDLIAGESLPDLERTVLLRRDGGSNIDWDRFVAAGDSVSDADVDALAAHVQPDDPMDLMFTSGTTGRPKGALLTHYQNIRGFHTWSALYGLNENDRYLIIPPFFHSFGYKGGWLSCVTKGSTILPGLTFDLDVLMPLIAREKVTYMPGPPNVYYALLEHPQRQAFDLSSLRMAMVSSTTIPVELVRRLYDDLKFTAVFTGYGLTENTALGTQTTPDDPPEKVANTSGRPIPDVEIRCIDAAGRVLEPMEPGEIVIRGYTVMKGYFNDPEATRAAIDQDGWLHTGDVGYLDNEGYLKITDRLKDMFIVGGFNCYPAEIEGILMRLRGVAQVAVIGVPDARMGEVGKAFVIRQAGAQLTEAAVIDWAREQMANFKVPRFVEFVESYPLNATGKVLKTELRARTAQNI